MGSSDGNRFYPTVFRKWVGLNMSNRIDPPGAITSKDCSIIPQGRAFFISKDIAKKCPYCGSTHLVIRAQRGGTFAVADRPELCPTAVQCLHCHAWGPESGLDESLGEILAKWNLRLNSWQSYRFRIWRWWHYLWKKS